MTKCDKIITNLNPRIISVSASDSHAAFPSISKASQSASEGDIIIVGPGTYSPKSTGETFPIYIPPGSKLIGSGSKTCKIDGQSSGQIVDRPLDPSQSLVLLGNETALSGFTISNSGANGVSNEEGARILITENVLENNGQHGLLIFGSNGAMIHKNEFINSGTANSKAPVPRESLSPGEQGSHIFVESRASCTNEVTIIENILQKAYADGIDAEVFDQPDGTSIRLQAIGNTISDCGRFGIAVASSYGPSNSIVFIEIRKNQIDNCKANGIDVAAALSLVNRNVNNAKLYMNIIQNKIKSCDCGINAFAAYDPSTNSQLECNIFENDIESTKRFGIRIIGGFCFAKDKWPVENNVLNAIVAKNVLSKTLSPSILIQGGIVEKGGQEKMVRNNSVSVQILGNQVKSTKEIVVNDGLPTNYVQVTEDSQPYTRKTGLVKYSEP